jgi:hypothetical protein
LPLLSLSEEHLKDLIRSGLGPNELLSSNRGSPPDTVPRQNAGVVIWSKKKLSGYFVVIDCEVAFEEAAQSKGNGSVL